MESKFGSVVEVRFGLICGGDGADQEGEEMVMKKSMKVKVKEGKADGVKSAKVLIQEAITNHLDINQIISPPCSPLTKPFRIADLGCSVGPNTFFAVQSIIDSIKQKYYSNNLDQLQKTLEFHVFFNDLVSNDFNVLFQSLPSDHQYFLAGVPGSFRRLLFPKASLHFVHSFYTLHWLSNIPKELVDKNSSAYNKGRVYWSRGPKEVIVAYRTQHAKELESFLGARAEEVVGGGLMALLVPCLPEGIPPFGCNIAALTDFLGDCLMDMVKLGLVSEDKVDTFNVPTFYATQQELKVLIERNGCFTVERIEKIDASAKRTLSFIQKSVAHIRATIERLIRNHFGGDISMDELFDRLAKKLVEVNYYSPSSSYKDLLQVFFLLKRKTT